MTFLPHQMVSRSQMIRALKDAGAVYHRSRWSTYYTPDSRGPAGKVDHGGPGWTIPGQAERMTAEDAYDALSEEG